MCLPQVQPERIAKAQTDGKSCPCLLKNPNTRSASFPYGGISSLSDEKRAWQNTARSLEKVWKPSLLW